MSVYKPWARPKPERATRILSVKRNRQDLAVRIDLLFYAGKIRRYLVISSRKLRALLKKARATELAPVALPANIAQVVIDTREELKTLVRQRTTSLNHRHRAPAQDDPPLEDDEAARKQREPIVVYGRFLATGRDKRSLRGKLFESVFLDMELDELGGRPRRFWGVDLERAVRESGAQPGDRIKLKQLGAIPIKRVNDDGGGNRRWSKPAHYNGYEVEIIGRAARRETERLDAHVH